MENIGNLLKGFYRDILTDPNQQVIYDSGWKTNTIVDSSRILLASFIKNEASNGIQSLMVGQGLEEWDAKGGIPMVDPITTVGLVTPYSDKTISVAEMELDYLDGDDDPKVSPTPTNRLQIKATLVPGYPPPSGSDLNTYPLREFGLFGKFGGTDYMINCVRHPVIHKDTSANLVRTIRLYF